MSKLKSTFEEQLRQNRKLLYTNVGDSMLPLIKEHRDVLVIERPKEWDVLPVDGTAKLSRLDIPLYRRDSGQYVLHRVLRVRKDDYVLCGDNRFQREYGISDRHVIGVLTAVIKNGRTIPVTKGKYRFYAHLWCDFFGIRALILFARTLTLKLVRKCIQRGYRSGNTGRNGGQS